MSDPVDQAFNSLAQEEALSLVRLCEHDNRKVLVVIISTDGEFATLNRATSAQTFIRHARGFMEMLREEAARIERLIEHTNG